MLKLSCIYLIVKVIIKMALDINTEKLRTIEDLATFIKNKPEDKQALYCMLLGAGASASSGIRTGQVLVEKWLTEVYRRLKNEDINAISPDEIRQYLRENERSWYDENNEYGSLFGKLYDLPNQRRNFIEREVIKAKEPSIGYKYLNRLAHNGEIDTFFTTNFDDLLEQSMSPYNDIKRPIVCAHDSSIFNISIRSQRTKIIKLHGDFLFKKLKSTNDELSDLETNMKSKFEEFLKNYGLITVGYAGNDDSIMKVLNDLLTKEEYLNNGIYWCIRKEDFKNGNNNKKVIDIKKKDKVYYVLIDNFDVFCAQLAHLVLNEEGKVNSPIQLGMLASARVTKQQEYFMEQKEKFNDCELIVNDINNSQFDASYSHEQIEQNNMDQNSKYEIKEKELKSEYNVPEEKDIRILIKNKQFNQALELIEKNITNKDVPSFLYNVYVYHKINCLVGLEQKQLALQTIDKVMQYNNEHKKDSNIPYLIKKASLVPDINEKISILEQAFNLDSSNYIILNNIAEYKIELNDFSKDSWREIMQLYDKSIDLSKTSDNDAYMDKLSFVIERHNDVQEIIDVCDQIINDLGSKDNYSMPVYDAKIEKIYRKIKNDKDNEKKYLLELKDIFNEYLKNNRIYERNIFYLSEYIKILSKLNNCDELIKIFSDNDLQYKDSILYNLNKTRCILVNFRNLNLAIKNIESIDPRLLKIARNDRLKYFSLYISLLFFNNEYQKAFDIINRQPDASELMRLDVYNEILFHIDKNKFFDKIMDEFEKSDKTTSDYITYTYNLLKLEEYDEIYEIYQKLINDKSNILVNKNDNILKINYNLAKKRRKNPSKITKVNLEPIFDNTKDTMEKAAAYILIDEQEEAQKIIKAKIDENYYYYFRYQQMPVFESINFKELEKEKISIKI